MLEPSVPGQLESKTSFGLLYVSQLGSGILRMNVVCLWWDMNNNGPDLQVSCPQSQNFNMQPGFYSSWNSVCNQVIELSTPS